MRSGEFVAVIGTGVSRALSNDTVPSLSWRGLIESGFAFANKKGLVSSEQIQAWKPQLESADIDELLSAAEFLSRKLEAPSSDLYARWLEQEFRHVRAKNNGMTRAVRALHSANVPICTLNYDTLLESITGLPTITFAETDKVAAWMRRETPGILHLHGTWATPSTCILGIRDYHSTIGDDLRDLFQRSLSSLHRLIFIGCGDTFADPNFSALIKWLRERMKTGAPQHYALTVAEETTRRHSDPTWLGFVEPATYGQSRSDLPSFLIDLFKSGATTSRKAPKKSAATSAIRTASLIQSYREYLIRDCGQMTIEGVNADMDMAQRKFDLERLFVPVGVLPSPPDIPMNDPAREKKLQAWEAEKRSPQPFGKVFEKHKRLALLALPGGGKSLLLKRLAVAYADTERREKSNDELPKLPLLPLLIRCREWREQIRRPIPTLLRGIADITGQTALKDLYAALEPLLKKGQILLLVDGLDEIHDDADRTAFVENLETFLDQYKSIRFVVTSREAGFGLVAPQLARFCQRWRIAPLSREAIVGLCEHWHQLMLGTAPEVSSDALELSNIILRNDSLRSLAENPLLLTMLLVVKHGAGRLPPDRVSLYGRATEVLLDTWNIRGHEPLNSKEAVPQLAYLAFQLLRAGKQSATANELLELLEEARERLPHIRRYAKDSPQKFLTRVELRSSLLVEAGRQIESGRTVPFYQFRHLTFQEYLAAVAAVEGLYREYKNGDTLLSPLEDRLTSEEWKEVIPMAAVLGKKQAEPLISALSTEGDKICDALEAGREFAGSEEWKRGKLPPATSRIVQCRIEEAEFPVEPLVAALRVVLLTARGCKSGENWRAICRGPYSSEVLHQAWLRYSTMKWPKDTWLRNTFASLAAFRKPEDYWHSPKGNSEIKQLLEADDDEQVALGLMTFVGLLWNSVGPLRRDSKRTRLSSHFPALPFATIEQYLFQDSKALWLPAVWALGLVQLWYEAPKPSTETLDRLLELWTTETMDGEAGTVGFAITSVIGLPREYWRPSLKPAQIEKMRKSVSRTSPSSPEHDHTALASLLIAFHSRTPWSDDELAALFGKIKKMDRARPSWLAGINAVVRQLRRRTRKPKRERTKRRRK